MGKAVIAVLDDDPRIGQIITAYMRDLDVLVEVFSDPVEFIRRLPKVNPDVLITDVRMPGMDGTEVLLKVKEYDPQIQVIVITGNADKALAMQVLRLGAFDLIEKPVE
ncbi:MAG: response regulator, partial [Bacteroidota bacterium]